MSYLSSILANQASNRGGAVAKQVLQSLGIIVQNIMSETGTHFLFSQGHLNSILETNFDFDDEEILGLFISLIKAISIKLSINTSQLFLQVSTKDGSVQGFPLYTEAVKFAHHKDGMVRARSVLEPKPLTLNLLLL